MCGLNSTVEGVLGEILAHIFKVKSRYNLNFSLFVDILFFKCEFWGRNISQQYFPVTDGRQQMLQTLFIAQIP